MEKNRDPGLGETSQETGQTDRQLIEQIHRELARLDLPCDCKMELDRAIVAIEAWHRLKRRKDLARSVAEDYRQIVSGISFLEDLGTVDQPGLTAQELRDHAESLKFLADLADRCARSLNELSGISDGD
ncbi:hypothetical protein [Roseibium sp.]|uniref:hypothetical protein n=1 Tax=Roseibium sp. TaxID=1936156 RepID=UPI003D0AEF69